MCGLEPTPRGDQRAKLLTERDNRLAEFMRQQRPIAAIAELEGLEADYCRKRCRVVAAERGIVYKPPRPRPEDKAENMYGLSDESKAFRVGLGEILYKHRESGQHQLDVARDIGLIQAAQVRATQRPFNHNWTISQIERLAVAVGRPFKEVLLECASK